jgi:hypothetical protein
MPAFADMAKAGKGGGEFVIDSARSASGEFAAGSVRLVGAGPGDPRATIGAERVVTPAQAGVHLSAARSAQAVMSPQKAFESEPAERKLRP